MALAVISVQHGGSLCELGRPPDVVVPVASPPVSTPAGVTRLADGTHVVADATGDRLGIGSGATWITYGSAGGGTGRFRRPSAVAAGPDAVYVADTGNDRVVRLAGLDASGPAPGGWASLGASGGATSGPFHFRSPSGVAASTDTLLVADTGNSRLVALPTAAFDSTPPDGWQVVDLPAAPVAPRPFGVARGPAGWAVSDVANARIHVLDEALSVVRTVATDRLRLGVPAFVAFDVLGRLLVADPGVNEVRLLSLGDRTRTVWRCRGSDPRVPAPLFERIGGVCAAAG